MQDPAITNEIDLDEVAGEPPEPESTTLHLAVTVTVVAGSMLGDVDLTTAVHRRLMGDHLVAVDRGRPSGDAWAIFEVGGAPGDVALLKKVEVWQ